MPVRSYHSIVDEILARPVSAGTRIVGIDGPAGSGKSFLSRRLADLLDAPRIETDDFAAWTNVLGWWPRFEKQVLRPLVAGQDAHFQVRDWGNDEFGESLGDFKTVAWSPVVIVEGVSCTRSSAGAAIAYRIWVDTPADVRLARGLARDGSSHEGLWRRWMAEEAEFFTADATKQRADLVVSGDPRESHDPDTEVVVPDG